MSLPFADLVVAARTAANRSGAIPLEALRTTLAAAAATSPHDAALSLARIAGGIAVDTATVRELELEIRSLSDNARSLVLRVTPALVDHSAVIQRALTGVVGSMSAILGAMVPLAVAVDATILQACREAGWGVDRLIEEPRRDELARRIVRALGVRILGESEEWNGKALAHLDPEREAAEQRRIAVESAVRSKLPKI